MTVLLSLPHRVGGTPVAVYIHGEMARRHRPYLGSLALAAFLVVQGLDGWLTYVGVVAFGIGVEANPILASLMSHLGHAPALVSAKIFAAGLGVCLHLQEIHSALALLTGLYLTVSIAPWAVILFF